MVELGLRIYELPKSSYQDTYETSLIALSESARETRFFQSISDEGIRRHVRSAQNSDTSYVFVAENIRGRVLGVIFFGVYTEKGLQKAEFGVSVADGERGKGVGNKLVDAMIARLRELGVQTLVMETLSRNAGMVKIGRNMGMKIARQGDGELVGEMAVSDLPDSHGGVIPQSVIDEAARIIDNARLKRSTELYGLTLDSGVFE